MLRASIARLGMHRGSGAAGTPGPAPVYAVVTLDDVTVPDGGTEAYVPVSLSHPVSGTALVLTLSDGVTATIPIGATSGLSQSYVVTPGGDPANIGIVSYTGGDFASLDISDTCVITPGQPIEMVRVYKGSIVKSTSGTLEKTELLALSGTTAALTEVDCEAVGGGASGRGVSGSGVASDGGTPGNVAVSTLAYDALPDVIEFSVGAGGRALSNNPASGGATSITGVVMAALSGTEIAVPKDRPAGPGQGAILWLYRSPDNDGGMSNAADPALALPGGIGSGDSRTSAIDGKDATSPFQHGSGGGSWNAAATAGKGGWPGGGGGKGSPGSPPTSGDGGAGAARFHVYSWEPAT